MTPFAAILKTAVEGTPHAIGGAFADSEGEMVDSFSHMNTHDWAVLTAHYGIVLSQLTDAFGTMHFGGPEYFIAQHKNIEIIVHAVEAGYYVLLAFSEPAPFEIALESLRTAAKAAAKEMQ